VRDDFLFDIFMVVNPFQGCRRAVECALVLKVPVKFSMPRNN